MSQRASSCAAAPPTYYTILVASKEGGGRVASVESTGTRALCPLHFLDVGRTADAVQPIRNAGRTLGEAADGDAYACTIWLQQHDRKSSKSMVFTIGIPEVEKYVAET